MYRPTCEFGWEKMRTFIGFVENPRKSGLLENKMPAVGQEKVRYGSYICPLNS